MNFNNQENIFTKVRFPTWFGLGLLTLGLIGGVVLVITPQVFRSQASITNTPKDVTITNLTATSATVSWLTDQPASGFAEIGTTSSLGTVNKDDRDQSTPGNYKIHFVTLLNLSPQTSYYLKITSGANIFPLTNPLSFTTAANNLPSNYQPLIGTVVNQNNQPINEALLILNIEGAQTLSAVTKVSGNFILPLADLKSSDLSQNFQLTKTNAIIDVITAEKHSKILITLPYLDLLPAIIAGQDLDLRNQVVNSSEAVESSTYIQKFDLNSDGMVNSLDLAIIYKNFGDPQDKSTDLNTDGVVNQQDVDLFNAYLLQSASP